MSAARATRGGGVTSAGGGEGSATGVGAGGAPDRTASVPLRPLPLPCAFQPIRCTAILLALSTCLVVLGVSRDSLFVPRAPWSVRECQPLWSWCVGLAVTLTVCLAPDLAALTVQPSLLDRYGLAFTATRGWRAAQSAFSMALLLCVPLCLLSAALILATSACDPDVPHAELLWLLLTLPVSSVFGLALMCNFGVGGGRVSGLSGRASQVYVLVACVLPFFAATRGSALTAGAFALLAQRWTRVNALLLIGGVALSLLAWVRRLADERIANRREKESKEE